MTSEQSISDMPAGGGKGISDSRFHMWRSVFALAHANGVVTRDEKEFLVNYFKYVPFSPQQLAVLKQDLEEPQNVNEMLIGVSDPADLSDFFQFAYMVAWEDDIDKTERRIMDRMTAEQMNRFNQAELSQNIREARSAAVVRRSIEDEEFRRQADRTGVLGWLDRNTGDAEHESASLGLMKETFKVLFDVGGEEYARDTNSPGGKLYELSEWMRIETFTAPDDDVFVLWRAVFSIVHADGNVAPEEKEYVEGMMDVFKFSDEQKAVIVRDLETPQSTVDLFGGLKSDEAKLQFFAMARSIVWCDGDYQPEERALMRSLQELVPEATRDAHKEFFEWIDLSPAMPLFDEEGRRKGYLMNGLFVSMVGFLGGNSNE